MAVASRPAGRDPNIDNPISPWWLVLIEGIAALIIGIWLVVSPARSTLVLIQVMAWFWIINGILNLVMLFVDRRMWGWKLFMGILGVLAGIWIVSNPIAGALTVLATALILLAVQAIIYGITALIASFQGAGVGSGVLGVVSIILGVLLLSEPFISALALPWVWGVFAIAGGVSLILAAFSQRSAAKRLESAGYVR